MPGSNQQNQEGKSQNNSGNNNNRLVKIRGLVFEDHQWRKITVSTGEP